MFFICIKKLYLCSSNCVVYNIYIDKENEDDSVSTPTIIADLQHLSEIRKVFSSVEYAAEMLGHVNTNRKLSC